MMELDKFGLTAERLVIEVLETVVANQDDSTITTNLQRLAELCCGIDLDVLALATHPSRPFANLPFKE